MKKILIATVMTLGMVTNTMHLISVYFNQDIMTEHFVGQVVKQLFPHKIVTNNAIVYTGILRTNRFRKVVTLNWFMQFGTQTYLVLQIMKFLEGDISRWGCRVLV